MITLTGLRNFLWCALAFGIVVCAATPTPLDRRAAAHESQIRARQAQQATSGIEVSWQEPRP